MARIRSVKPELRDSQLVASWDFDARYFWVLFWGYLDDSGRGLDLAKRIAGDCFPHDEIDASDIDRWLNMMTKGIDGEPGPVCRYKVRGKAYVHAVNWHEHQKPNRPTPSRIPPCPEHELLPHALAEVTAFLTEDVSEDLNQSAVPGAAEQQSRGAGEQQHAPRESVTARAPAAQTNAAAEFVTQTLKATPHEATEVIRKIQKARSPTNLPGLLRTMARAGDLQPFLDAVRKDAGRRARTQFLADAKLAAPCIHGKPGGNLPHPDSGQPICADCRHQRPAAAA